MATESELANATVKTAQPCPLCRTSCDCTAASSSSFSDAEHSNVWRSNVWYVEQRHPLAGRIHVLCPHCAVVFVPSQYHLPAAAEKAYYDLHDNQPNDEGYRRFLGRAAEPIVRLLPAGAQGLDFGCGPGPTLSLILKEQGMHCADYDLYYANHPQLLQRQYDFITSTEVFEHLANPRAALNQLVPLLNANGLLVIMTQRPRDKAAFAKWQYILDPTHITFFNERSFQYIAEQWQIQLLELHQDVVVFKKL